MTKRTGPTNPLTKKLISDLEKLSVKEKAKIWKDVASRLQKPARIMAEVNVGHLQGNLRDGETALVPGKLLGTGNVGKAVTVAAFSASESAKNKINAAKGEFLTLQELMKKNPKGAKVRILQ